MVTSYQNLGAILAHAGAWSPINENRGLIVGPPIIYTEPTYHKVFNKNDEKRKQILEMHFLVKMKPQVISRKLRLPPNVIYVDVELAKKHVSKAINMQETSLTDKKSKYQKSTNLVKAAVEKMKNDWITAEKNISKD